MKRLIFLPLLLWASLVSGADIFVWSGATGLNDGSSWEDAYTSLCRDYGAEAGFDEATEFVYVRSVHAESTGSACTIQGLEYSGGSALTRILSVVGDTTGTTPGNLQAGAEVETTDASGVDIIIENYTYIYGVEFYSDDQILIGTQNNDRHYVICDNCVFNTDRNGGLGISINQNDVVAQKTVFIDTDVALDTAAGRNINNEQGWFIWEGGSTTTDSGQELFATQNQGYNVNIVRGVDLSGWDEPALVETSGTNASRESFERVLLHANTIEVLDGNSDEVNLEHQWWYTESGASANPTLSFQHEGGEGRITLDTARTRTGGASDGTQSYSWSLDTTEGALAVTPGYVALRSPPIDFWAEGDASTTHTYRFYLANTSSLDDDEFWIKCMFQNDAATDSLGVFKTNKPDPLTTPSALTSDGSTWSGTDVTTQMRIDLTHQPDKSGFARCWAYLALDSERVSFDPFVDIDP